MIQDVRYYTISILGLFILEWHIWIKGMHINHIISLGLSVIIIDIIHKKSFIKGHIKEYLGINITYQGFM